MTISVIELPRITALGEPIASETSSSAPERRVSTKAKHIVIAVALAAIVAPTSNMGQPVTALIGGLTDSSSNGTVSVPQQTEPSIKRPSVALSVRHLYEASGLTWEQLARLFGVSRRAVHNWANGGRMTDFHAGLLSRLTRVIDQLPAADAASRRAYLLAPGEDGHSLYEHVRAQLAESVDVINEPSLALDQRLGVASDD